MTKYEILGQLGPSYGRTRPSTEGTQLGAMPPTGMCSIPVQYLRGSATIGPECPTKGDTKGTKGFQLGGFIFN